jgi:tetratricopeptide (TPR) repeat protein
MCGGDLEVVEGMSVAECQYCGTQQTLPKLDDDKKANLYDRAGHFRRNNDFDKAISVYEKILEEDRMDSEAYWSLVLCKYGIEYVEDPTSHKRIPTVNRAQFTSIFMDEDYKSAIQYADGYQKSIYEAEAKAIDDIQKGILAISEKEEPFDVFICYKETDNNGRRTQDSVLANDLYHQLTQEGFKVFFARITLEDKLGVAYEPYIFAGLNSAKVMVVLGTKPEYFNAVWVKNEWSRYLALIKNGAKKILIPAYKDMDPYDLPEEFSHLQAQDMSKLGFMQDLIRGIKKITESDKPEKSTQTVVVNSNSSNTESLLKRVAIFLSDGDFSSAKKYCERVLDIDPECSKAYLYRMMVDFEIKSVDDVDQYSKPLADNSNYQKAVRFASATEKPILEQYNQTIVDRLENERLEGIYSNACTKLANARVQQDCLLAKQSFESIKDYKDSAERITICEQKIAELKELEKQKEEQDRIAREEYKKRQKKKILTAIVSVVVCVCLVVVGILEAVKDLKNYEGTYSNSSSVSYTITVDLNNWTYTITRISNNKTYVSKSIPYKFSLAGKEVTETTKLYTESNEYYSNIIFTLSADRTTLTIGGFTYTKE